MDVGSQGGAWTKKSPKLLLLEWTQAQKRSKPRYKALPEAEGKFRCKVSALLRRQRRNRARGALECTVLC